MVGTLPALNASRKGEQHESTSPACVGVAAAAAKRGDVLIAGIAGRVAGKWLWKDAYDAVEAAQLLFLRRYLRPCAKRAAG